jgi:hypothetical protein
MAGSGDALDSFRATRSVRLNQLPESSRIVASMPWALGRL